jgi:hypothetical protein
VLFLSLALLLAPAFAGAQELYTYTVGALGGFGGSPDVDSGDGFDNTGLQLNLGMVTERNTLVGVRLGRLQLDSDESFGSFQDAELSYVTVGGEYRFQQTYYDSGVYIALGGYRLDGTRGGEDDQETSAGLSIGLTGEFKVNRWLGVLVELSGHYVDFDEEQLFGMAHGGLTFHF